MQRTILDTDYTFDITNSETSDERIFMKVPKGTVVFVYSQNVSPKTLPTSPQPIARPSPSPSSSSNVDSPQQRKKKESSSSRKVYQPKGANTNSPPPSSNGATSNGLFSESKNGNGNGNVHANGNSNGVSSLTATTDSKKTLAKGSSKVPSSETPYVYYEKNPQQEKWLQARREAMKKEKEEADKRYRERVERQKKKKEEEEAKLRAEAEARGEVYDPQSKGKGKDKAKGKGRGRDNGKGKGNSNSKSNNFSRERRTSPKSEGAAEKENTPRSCWICTSAEHLSRHCPDRCKRVACTEQYGIHALAACNYLCEVCGGKGHDPRFCEKRCTLCKRDPHLASKCPVECPLCGEKASHREKDCPHSYQNRHLSAVSVKA